MTKADPVFRDDNCAREVNMNQANTETGSYYGACAFETSFFSATPVNQPLFVRSTSSDVSGCFGKLRPTRGFGGVSPRALGWHLRPPIISGAEIFFEPDIKADEQIAAAHFLDL